MKVVHVLRSLEFGGAERLVLELARTQAGAGGLEVGLACLMEGGQLEDEARDLGFEVRTAPQGGIRYISGILRMRSLLKRAAPDIVHTHNFLAHVHAAPAARSLGIPVVHTKHGRAVSSMSWSPALRRRVYRLSSSIALVSREAAEVFAGRSGLGLSELTVVHNGIDTERFRPPEQGAAEARRAIDALADLPSDAIVFGSVSRLDPVKDHMTMLKAFAEVAGRGGGRSVLMITGEGPERSRIEEAVRTMSLGGRVIMPGFTADVPRYLASMDMYLQPSIEEGLSLTLLEAAACGVPVAATAVGGNPEVIEDGVTGSLVDVGDWKSLADVMQGFVDDPGRFRRMAARAREKVVEEFSLASMERAYRRLYERAAGKKGA